jgi:hypothetical protein
MKCRHCGENSRYKDWKDTWRCPKCRRPFVFAPREGDPFSDIAFQRAIDIVSAEGRVRWGVEHLYYLLDRRLARSYSQQAASAIAMLAVFITVLIALSDVRWWLRQMLPNPVAVAVGTAVLAAVLATAVAAAWRRRFRPALDRHRFESLYDRWTKQHGPPAGVIQRKQAATPAPDVETDVGDYSFDRAVICDRARTVDLLLANNFHFENNCAILSVDGYPAGPFKTVREMLKRNPRLAVYVLHDATPRGCRLARTLAQDPDWFGGRTVVVDVGLRPVQAVAIRGPYLPGGSGDVGTAPGLTPEEGKWLARHRLELAVIRPEQVVKRLFRAINQPLTARPDADNVIHLCHRTRETGSGGGDETMIEEADDADGAFDAFG